jgi:hypothetical protein
VAQGADGLDDLRLRGSGRPRLSAPAATRSRPPAPPCTQDARAASPERAANNWDDATRGEWGDIRGWGRVLVGTSVVVGAYFVARLVTTSYLALFAIVIGVSAIVGPAGGRLEKQRSRTASAEQNAGPST